MLPRYGQSVSFSEALELSRRNANAKWPRSGPNCRLEPEAWPHMTPRFSLKAGSRIFTMGSCFARNIEEYLNQLKFEVPALRMVAPEDAEGGRSNAILNKYTPAAIFQEIQWTRSILDRDGVVRWSDVEPLMLETTPGLYLDLQLSTSISVPKERALARRAELLAINKDGFESDVVVITPGVIEAWLDTATGQYIQRAPQPRMAERLGADRFQLKVLTYEECYDFLNRTVDLIDPERRKWFLFTVSPVPLARTFTDQDVIVANQYSKSLLRAAVGRIWSERPNCDYFPSYETVMLTRQPYVWQEDLIHIADAFVAKIVRHLVASRVEGGSFDQHLVVTDAITRFQECLQRDDTQGALAAYSDIEGRAAEIEIGEFHLGAANFFLGQRRFGTALLHAERLAELRPGKWRPSFVLARAQFRAGAATRARQTAATALTLARNEQQRAMVEELLSRNANARDAATSPAQAG
jgi:hypothetical protein